MIQKIYIPQDPELRKVINFFSYVEITSEDQFDGFTAIFPNATSNLIFSLNKNILVNHSSIQNSLYASCSSTIAFCPYIGMKFISVQFNSYGLSYLKQIPAEELYNSLLDPNIFFSASDLSNITNQLKELKTVYEKFIILELFLKRNMRWTSIDERLPYALAYLKSAQQVSLSRLSESFGITNRSLQKLFKKHIGMSPSQFRNIVRFNQAANLILKNPDLSLTHVAYDCGYFDQSHFIKDFKKFGGILPSKFSDLKASCSDFYNYNLKEIGILGSN